MSGLSEAVTGPITSQNLTLSTKIIQTLNKLILTRGSGEEFLEKLEGAKKSIMKKLKKLTNISGEGSSSVQEQIATLDAKYLNAKGNVYLRGMFVMILSTILTISFHDMFSMILLQNHGLTCRTMAWGGIQRIVFMRFMLLIPAIIATCIFAGIFATITLVDDDLLNYKMIGIGISIALVLMSLFYAWKRKNRYSVEYLMLASLMDPNGEGRSRFVDQCKKNRDFKNIMKGKGYELAPAASKLNIPIKLAATALAAPDFLVPEF